MKHKDKVKHFVLSFILAALFYWLTENRILVIILVLTAGLAKELYDQKKKKNTIKESVADFLVDVLGITVGILFSQYLL